jgi:hypothetical protein
MELLVVEDCPHTDSARRLLRMALDDLGLAHLTISVTVIASRAAAIRRGFAGSPSFFADGRDLLADGAAVPAHACRLYQTSSGISALPDPHQLREALERASRTTA